jgi:anaerobic ribonucleoside-triphosphate reductase
MSDCPIFNLDKNIQECPVCFAELEKESDDYYALPVCPDCGWKCCGACL